MLSAHTESARKSVRKAKSLHGDPLLDEVHELLHHVLACPSGETTHWMVRQALVRLSLYEKNLASLRAKQG